ncbi:MAG: NAD-dependent epimerase/dehydratase family protein [Pseudomonadales bacterium]|nr:NAD-dependent epimerase/dehydratase family protein [Pseudomonadales bacterium]
MQKALVVGGSGVTGIHIVNGLLARDYEVTVLNRGMHAAEFSRGVECLQANPYEKEALLPVLEGRTFDLAVIAYGRLRHVMKSLVGKTERIISVGGAAPVYKGWGEMMAANPWETTRPTPLFLSETHALATAETKDPFSMAVRFTETELFAAHQQGLFNITHFRYPLVYGPNNICPAEWGLIRRARDKRAPLILPDGGLAIVSRGYAENVAHAVLLAVDKPRESAGETYNVCDERLLYNHEWVSLVGEILQHRFEPVDIPFDCLPSGFRATPPQLLYRHHCVMDLSRLKKLGYRDVVSVEHALEKTVHWYMNNPLPAEGEVEQNLGDPFDYSYEDALLKLWHAHKNQFAEQLEQLPSVKVVWKHPYQH